MKHLYLCALVCLANIGINTSTDAQTISDFDALPIPGTAVSYSESLPIPATEIGFNFVSAYLFLEGTKFNWGGFNNWDVSRATDTVTASYTNDKSSIVGMGQGGSSQYAVCYLPSNYPSLPHESLVVPALQQGPALGKYIAGAYFTNTTYAYRYFQDYFTPGDSFQVMVKAMHLGVITDSIIFDLARITVTDTNIVNKWLWVPMLSLGPVDTLLFQVHSSDDFAPYYIAMDGLVTLIDYCPPNPTAISVTPTSVNALITWPKANYNATRSYEVAVDQSLSLAPLSSTISTTIDTSFVMNDLLPGTDYVFHIRSLCVDSTCSTWDTVKFSTFPSLNISSIAGQQQIVVYPNPANIVLHIPTLKGANSYQIIDQLGRNVQQDKIQEQVIIGNLPSGIFTIMVYDKDQKRLGVAKFVKK